MLPPRELIDVLNRARRPLLVGHVNPDVDAIGSVLALARCMADQSPAIAVPAGVQSQKILFLRSLAETIPLADADRLAESDPVIVLDTATPKRVCVEGGWDALTGKTVINIDHHVTNTDFGHVNWVIDNASSTCEVVYHIIGAAGWPIDRQTATLLYAGIYTDTAGFSLPNTSPAAFETAAALLRLGADIEQVGARLCRSQAPHEFDLIRLVYHNTRLAGDRHIAYSTVSFDELSAAGCTQADIDDQVSIPRSLSGIQLAILFSEGEPGVVRINLRGENGTTVLPLAQRLGGGGHTYAAGVRMRGEFNQVVERVLDEASRFLEHG